MRSKLTQACAHRFCNGRQDALPEGIESSFPEGEGAARKEKVRTALDNLQSSMDWLRVSVKYLVFDLEATKRDNERLRGLLRGDSESDTN